MVVVTRHDTNSALFNTKFRLNFGRLPSTSPDQFQDILDNPNELLIGRSSSCNMVLDYRTVSTVHAKISYENGGFYIQDKKSSNGTMMYLQEAFPLPFSHPCRLRMGRTTISLQPKRSLTASLRDAFTRSRNNNDESGSYLTPQQFQTLMASASATGLSGFNNRPGSALITTLVRGTNHDQFAELNRNGFISNFTPSGARSVPLAGIDGNETPKSRIQDTRLSTLNINLENNDGNDGPKNLTGRYTYESFHESLHSRTVKTPLTLSQQRMDNVQNLLQSIKDNPLKDSEEPELTSIDNRKFSASEIGVLPTNNGSGEVLIYMSLYEFYCE